MRNWIAKLFGFDLEINDLKKEISLKEIELSELNKTLANAVKAYDGVMEELIKTHSKLEEHPQPYNPRQSWGARKRRLEEMERKREVKAQVDTTEKYWKNKDESIQ